MTKKTNPINDEKTMSERLETIGLLDEIRAFFTQLQAIGILEYREPTVKNLWDFLFEICDIAAKKPDLWKALKTKYMNPNLSLRELGEKCGMNHMKVKRYLEEIASKLKRPKQDAETTAMPAKK